jgi:chemotaxis protein methyltransferase CheR
MSQLTTMTSTLFPYHHDLFDLIQERLALTLDDQRRAEIMRSVDELSAAEGIARVQDLAMKLTELPITQSLWQRIIRMATVGETYFFRDRSQLNALQNIILPGLIVERRLQGRKQLRLWSAGCATGEEPYTLAIILRELIPDFATWNISILATDLNMSHLDRAKEGKYRPWSFRAESPAQVREHWFTEEDGNYQIDPSIRSMVTFAPLNLASDEYPSFSSGTLDMDIILCRNVLIYFDNLTIAAVIKRFQAALSPQGWLVLGHAESAHIVNGQFEPRNFEHAVLYQKYPVPEPSHASCPDVIEAPIISDTVLPPSKSLSNLTATPRPVKKRKVDVGAITAEEEQDPWEPALLAANKEQWSEALHQGQVQAALSSLRQSIYCDREFVLAHFVLGEIYEQQGQFKKAFYQWKQAYNVLSGLPADQALAYSDDLTVEILRAVLEFRLDNLPIKGSGGDHAAP